MTRQYPELRVSDRASIATAAGADSDAAMNRWFGPLFVFEFMDTVISWTSDDKTVRLPSTRIQPVAAADVVDAVIEVAVGVPVRGIRHVAGPDVFRLDELGRLTLAARGDGRSVITDDRAGTFAAVTGDELVPGPYAVDLALSTLIDGVALEPMRYEDWIQKSR